jgi:hypothetical protein
MQILYRHPLAKHGFPVILVNSHQLPYPQALAHFLASQSVTCPQLSTLCGVSRSTVYKWLQNTRPIPANVWTVVQHYLEDAGQCPQVCTPVHSEPILSPIEPVETKPAKPPQPALALEPIKWTKEQAEREMATYRADLADSEELELSMSAKLPPAKFSQPVDVKALLKS